MADKQLVRKPIREMENDIFALIKKGDIEPIEQLLEKNPLLVREKKPPHESTPLHYSVLCKHIQLARYFAKLVDDIDEMDSLGRTCLHYAAWEGDYDLAKILIESGADVNAREGNAANGKTPLIRAAENGHADIVELLLLHSADAQLTITRRPYKLNEILKTFPDAKWILTAKDCASTKAVCAVFEKYEKPL